MKYYCIVCQTDGSSRCSYRVVISKHFHLIKLLLCLKGWKQLKIYIKELWNPLLKIYQVARQPYWSQQEDQGIMQPIKIQPIHGMGCQEQEKVCRTSKHNLKYTCLFHEPGRSSKQLLLLLFDSPYDGPGKGWDIMICEPEPLP